MCWNPPKYNRSIPDITLASRQQPVLYSKSTRVALYDTYLYYTLSLKATSNFWITPSETNQFTSATVLLEVMFWPPFVCLSVCLSAESLKKVMGEFLYEIRRIRTLWTRAELIIFWKWSGTYFGYRTLYHPYDCIGFTRRGHYGRLQRL